MSANPFVPMVVGSPAVSVRVPADARDTAASTSIKILALAVPSSSRTVSDFAMKYALFGENSSVSAALRYTCCVGLPSESY